MMRSSPPGTLIIAGALAVCAPACQFHSDHGGTRYRCDEGNRCPADGYQCVAGFCEAEEGPADGQGLCSTLTMLAEDFAAPIPDAGAWLTETTDAATAEHAGGQLVLGFAVDQRQEPELARYRSRQQHRLDAGRAFVEVPPLDTTSPVELTFAIETYNGNACLIRHRQGTLSFAYRLGTTDAQPATVEYSAAEHRWWRMREKAGLLYWETSPDRADWTIHATVESGPFLGPGHLVVSAELAEVPDNPAEPIRVVVDNINGGVESQEWWCASGSVHDDYDGEMDSTAWRTFGAALCTIARAGGQLALDWPPGRLGDCGYASRLPYDLRGSTVAVEVPAVAPPGSGVTTALELVLGNGDTLAFRHDDGTLYGAKVLGGEEETAAALPHDPAAHRWWRLRGEDTTVHWETSPDGETWTIEASHASPPLDLDEVTIQLTSSAAINRQMTSGVRFDNLNPQR